VGLLVRMVFDGLWARVSCFMSWCEVSGAIGVLRAEGGGDDRCERKLKVETPVRLRSEVLKIYD
jgi:hypothetical protein